MRHQWIINEAPKATPTTALPDGAVTGNGDVSLIWGGTSDRISLYLGKADFWCANGRIADAQRGGLASPGKIEILLPQMAYAPYHVEQDMDAGVLRGIFRIDGFDAALTVTVCALENTVLLELDRTWPGLSASVSLRLPDTSAYALEGNGAVGEVVTANGVQTMTRVFAAGEHLRFPSEICCVLREVSRVRENGRERIRWAVCIGTNHDSAAYRCQSAERAAQIDDTRFEALLCAHRAWWSSFWAKSGVTLDDEALERHWYTGIYITACCMRNEKFPPGLWGSYCTTDGMGWFGDYHLNYNYEAPFYALANVNHAELLGGYMAPLNDFIPRGQQYAKEYHGCRGIFYPVGIGPLGMETDIRPETKEHGHLFLGQKSNASYAAVVPMLHWYATRDTAFAKREYYEYLLQTAAFWEDYLVFENGEYSDYNDSLHEVGWYMGPDYMPDVQDDRNPLLSACLIRMLMKLLIDLSQELGENTDKIAKWQEIHDHAPAIGTFVLDGVDYIRCKDGSEWVNELTMECVYPMGIFGKYITPEFFDAIKNTHQKLSIWDSHNRFCSYYPAAARLGIPADEIIGHIHEIIETRSLPNGMFRYNGGGIENSSAIPSTVNEMLLQSYEGIVRLFPVWEHNRNASFRGLRAHGAFVVDASLSDGVICAELTSEHGQLLRLERPGDGYICQSARQTVVLDDPITEIQTEPGELFRIYKEN